MVQTLVYNICECARVPRTVSGAAFVWFGVVKRCIVVNVKINIYCVYRRLLDDNVFERRVNFRLTIHCAVHFCDDLIRT